MTAGGRTPSTKDRLHRAIGTSVRRFEWDKTGRLAADYAQQVRSGRALDPVDRTVLQLLLKNRQYVAVTEVADAALAVDPGDRAVWRSYAQALIDEGRIAPALHIYTGLAADPAASAEDHSEARGGVGRCYKQLLLSETDQHRRADYLRLALEAYTGLYDADRRLYWHGINAVALLAYAARESLVPKELSDPDELSRITAANVLATVEGEDGAWELATACEAHIARGEIDEALKQAHTFVISKKTDAFMVASLLRQVLEVWQPDPESAVGTTLIPLLRSALVKKTGGSVTLTSEDVAATRIEELAPDHESGRRLEKVFGPDRFNTVAWWRTGLERCRAVVRIADLNGEGKGTGFLINGSDLHPNLSGCLVVTNFHVVPDGLQPTDARVTFHGLDDDSSSSRTSFGIARIRWQSPLNGPGVDTAILELDGEVPAGVKPIPIADPFPTLGSTSRTYIIGHPRGYEQPQFSIQDNLMLDSNDTYLHYRTPTEPGSSGSPVFEKQWKLIGLHHAGDFMMPKLKGKDTYQANEALRIDKIRAAIAAEPPDANT